MKSNQREINKSPVEPNSFQYQQIKKNQMEEYSKCCDKTPSSNQLAPSISTNQKAAAAATSAATACILGRSTVGVRCNTCLEMLTTTEAYFSHVRLHTPLITEGRSFVLMRFYLHPINHCNSLLLFGFSFRELEFHV